MGTDHEEERERLLREAMERTSAMYGPNSVDPLVELARLIGQAPPQPEERMWVEEIEDSPTPLRRRPRIPERLPYPCLQTHEEIDIGRDQAYDYFNRRRTREVLDRAYGPKLPNSLRWLDVRRKPRSR